MAAEIRLLNFLHGSGSTILVPGFDYDTRLCFWNRGREQVGRTELVGSPPCSALLWW